MKLPVIDRKMPMETRNKGKRSQISGGLSGKGKRSKTPVKSLPDDVVVEILSRLPANDVLKLRMVCRKWRDLISTQYFGEMHMKAEPFSSQMIIVEDNSSYTYKNGDKLLLLDKWVPPRKRPTIRKVSLDFLPSYGCCLSSLSNDGLVIFNDPFSNVGSDGLIVFNPITGDKVTIISPRNKYSFYGMFFNPLVKEYCLLLKSGQSSEDVEFKILNLGSEPCCRALKHSNSFMHNPRSFLRDNEPPVVIDNATVYWMVESRLINKGNHYPSCEEIILAFDIKTEKFNLMPHPGPVDGCDRSKHLNMHLFKMDDCLSCINITLTTISVVIDIWTLKDSASRLWIKSPSVIVDVEPFNIGGLIGRNFSIFGLSGQNFKVMAAGNGELLVRCSYYSTRSFCRFYVCNMELGTARSIGRTYRRSLRSTFVPSFVSLRNCKSQISI